MRLGPSDSNSWDVDPDFVDLVRRPQPIARCVLKAHPQSIAIDLNRTALIVVDMQNDFCTSGGWFHSRGHDLEPARRPIAPITRLLEPLRERGVLVLWLNWGNRPDCANLPPSVFRAGRPHGTGYGYGDRVPGGQDPVLVRGSWGARVIDDFHVMEGDMEVWKYRFSGFSDNELDSVLRNRSVTTLLFAGINTDRCIFATLMDASFLGYDCILVEDACSTPSPAHCTQTVHYLVRHLYGFTTDTDSVLSGLASLEASANASALGSFE